MVNPYKNIVLKFLTNSSHFSKILFSPSFGGQILTILIPVFFSDIFFLRFSSLCYVVNRKGGGFEMGEEGSITNFAHLELECSAAATV